MNLDELTHWMQRAMALARTAETLDEVPIGAVLVHEGKEIASGHNSRELLNKTTAHAELVALDQYNQGAKSWRLKEGTSLFVTLEPCLMCTGAYLWARLDHLYFGCPDPKGAGLSVVKSQIEKGTFDHRFKTIQSEILADDCSSILKNYFRKKRQTLRPN